VALPQSIFSTNFMSFCVQCSTIIGKRKRHDCSIITMILFTMSWASRNFLQKQHCCAGHHPTHRI